MNQIQTFSDWKELMLQRRSMEVPDGRQLYQYRLGESEFNDLEAYMRQRIESLLEKNDFSHIAIRTGFPDLFVLYGAEWWRRRYDGSGFAWEPIIRDLGADPTGWSHSHRSECVQHGLAGWKLRVLQTTGFRFLGAVAVQGGLPLRLLADARGGIGHLIGRVLRLCRNRIVSPTDIQDWVESLRGLLPKSFRQDIIYALLCDIAWTVLQLKQAADLTPDSDAIASLDRNVPRWRERFPLPVDDIHAKALIDQLIRDAASIRLERPTVLFPIERSLESNGDGLWKLRSNLDLPDAVTISDISKLFEIGDLEDLPRAGELSITAAEKTRTTNLRRMVGQDSYRIGRTPWGFSSERATSEHVLSLTSVDGRVWHVPAPRGQALDDDLPWVFSADDPERTLVREGSGSVAALEVLVAAPNDWSFSAASEAELVAVGNLEYPSRKVFRLKGSVTATDKSGATYRFVTGQAASSVDSYDWRGNRLWYDFRNPRLAFRGCPSLDRIREDGTRHPVSGEIGCFDIGSPLSSNKIGPVFMRYPANGEVKFRSKMLLLPDSADLRIIPDDPRSGVILFEGWGISAVRVESPGVKSRSVVNNGDLLLELSVAAPDRAPDQVELLISWRHTTSSVRLFLPFPAKGARCFDGPEREVTSGEKMAVQRLLGTRLVILGANQYARKILRLRAADKDISRKYPIQSVVGALSSEIRISDYRSEIEQLLTIDDNPDSTVWLTLELNDNVEFSLEIAPFEVRPERGDSEISVDFGVAKTGDDLELEVPRAMAMRLENPGSEPLTLTVSSTTEPGKIAWNFNPAEREPGAWLIYPPVDSTRYFRPTLWTVHGEGVVENEYITAISVGNEDERNAALDALIVALASDFLHPNWLEVEQIAGQIGHLPLATLSLWRRFAHSSQGMAALALRYSSIPARFIFRFAQELPFSWDAISFAHWKQATELTEIQCKQIFGNDQFMVVAESFLSSRMSDFAAEIGSLFYVLGILRGKYWEDAKKDVEGLRAGGHVAAAWLFNGANSPLMRLRRGHLTDNEEWPAGFSDYLTEARRDPDISRYLYPERLGFQDGVINLPLLLAAQISCDRSNGWFEDPARIHSLRHHKAFDPDWFDEAFNQTIARCLADGRLDS